MEQEAEPQPPKNFGEPGEDSVEAWPAIRVRAPERRVVHRASPPRLSVQCLLFWVAGAAVAMAAVRRLNPAEPGAIGLLLVSGYAAGCGAAWTGLGLWIARALRGANWPVEPGHWLLAAAGARLALELAIRLGAPQAFASPQAVLDAATCCALALPLLSRSLPVLWQCCFALLCLLATWPLGVILLQSFGFALPEPLGASGSWVERWQPCLVAFAAAGFALVDWRAWRQRTWLHWTGLGVVFWLALLAGLAR